MTQRVFRTGSGGNTAFGDDFHALTQMRSQFHRLTKSSLAQISAVNIGMIDGGDPEIKMFLDKTDQLARGHIPVHQTPVTHNKT
ncbi:hypothetical protein D3C76_1531770 [compost metagenome]